MKHKIFFLVMSIFLQSLWSQHIRQNSLLSPVKEPSTFSAKVNFSEHLPYLVSGVGLFGLAQIRLSQLEGVPQGTPKQRDKLLPWDQPFAGTYSENWRLTSDLLTVLGIAPFFLWTLTSDESKFTEGVQDVLQLSEILLLSSGMNLLVRSLIYQPRPLVYSDAPSSEKEKPEAGHSFYSGHTSAAFALATFSAFKIKDRISDPHIQFWSITSIYTLATLQGISRIGAGKHYPSDVLVGALVGSFWGWAIPTLQKTRRSQYSNPLECSKNEKQFTLIPWVDGKRLGMFCSLAL